MKMDLEITIEVEGTATLGSPRTFMDPGEPSYAEIDHVWLGEDKKVDILNYLSKDELQIIEEWFMDEEGEIEPEPYDTTYERDMDR